MSLDEARELAKWRRKWGVWYVTFIVEGFDEEFTLPEPGKLSEKFAVGLASVQLAKELGVSRKIIHHKSTRREG